MIIAVVIFCTVVSGIAGMEDMKKVGRVGGKALLYFEVVSTLALVIGLVIGNLVPTGSSLHVNPATLDAKAVANYSNQAKAQSVPDFLLHIIPTTMVDAFTRGDILQVLLIALLFGFALSAAGPRCKPVVDLFTGLTHAVFGVINNSDAPRAIGAFGAMAFTIGQYEWLRSAAGQADCHVLHHEYSVRAAVVLGAIAQTAGSAFSSFCCISRKRLFWCWRSVRRSLPCPAG